MAGIDINRSSTGIQLTPEQSSEIWSAVDYSSAVAQLSQRIALPGAGQTIDVITGEPEAQWVAETDEKPIGSLSFGTKLMQPYTAAVIVPFSNQFKRDKVALYNEIVRKLPQALAKKLDSTVLGGTAPGSNFDTLTGVPAVDLSTDVYDGLVAADQSIATNDGVLNGWAISPQGRGLLLGAKDGNGRPLFINNVQTDGAVPALLGSPVYQTRGVYAAGTPATIGYAGDWTGATLGVTQDITLDYSDQATLTDGDSTINLWQRNMFAVRVEFEVGYRVRDINRFAKLTYTAS